MNKQATLYIIYLDEKKQDLVGNQYGYNCSGFKNFTNDPNWKDKHFSVTPFLQYAGIYYSEYDAVISLNHVTETYPNANIGNVQLTKAD